MIHDLLQTIIDVSAVVFAGSVAAALLYLAYRHVCRSLRAAPAPSGYFHEGYDEWFRTADDQRDFESTYGMSGLDDEVEQ